MTWLYDFVLLAIQETFLMENLWVVRRKFRHYKYLGTRQK